MNVSPHSRHLIVVTLGFKFSLYKMTSRIITVSQHFTATNKRPLVFREWMAFIIILTLRGFPSSFQNRSACHPIAKKCNSCRNLQMSTTKKKGIPNHSMNFLWCSLRSWCLMWYFRGIFFFL